MSERWIDTHTLECTLCKLQWDGNAQHECPEYYAEREREEEEEKRKDTTVREKRE